MADLEFDCPHCNKSLEAPEELFGKSVQCPGCGGVIMVEVPEDAVLEGDPEAAEADRKSILIVDDEETIRTTFQLILADGIPNVNVHLACNGKEAIEAFKEHHYDIIVMDLRMPVMGGHEAFQKINKLCEEEDYIMPSVIFCTGYSPPSVIQKLVAESPNRNLLLKPTTSLCMLKAVQEQLEADAAG